MLPRREEEKNVKKRQLYRIPNRLMNDAALTYSARQAGNALYSKRSRLGQCVMSLAYLAKVSACSIPTVRKAVEELENAGYIRRCRNYQYSEQAGCVTYARTTYVCTLSTARDYTLVPREVIYSWALTSGAFCVCLCLFQQAGNSGRAFPAIRRIAQLFGMGYATVCQALALLRNQRLALVLHCKKRNHAFSMNSYFMQGRGQRQEKSFIASSDDFVRSLLHSIVDFARTERNPPLLSVGVSFFANCFRT